MNYIMDKDGSVSFIVDCYFLSPVVSGKKEVRKELFSLEKKSVVLSVVSGVFLTIHFVLWFESLKHTTVASSTTPSFVQK